jgi:glucose/arabinose dehydrogenase
VVVTLVLALAFQTLAVHAAPAPAGPDLTLALVPVLTGVPSPIGVTNAGDGSGRLFIVNQDGQIVIWDGARVLPEPVLDVTALIGRNGSETGLLGLAFHPDYRNNGLFYIYFTALDGANTLMRFHVSAGDPNRADPASGQLLFALPDRHPQYHQAGMLLFGPDGYLYVSVGDEGFTGDSVGNAQNPDAMFGKILRLDVDHGGDAPYAIPPDNPFVGRDDARPEVWVMGLRNPWRFSIDSASGDLWIGDVGQDRWEEIDRLPGGSSGGANFGWNRMEGFHCYPEGDDCDQQGLTPPVAEYSHAEGCAVIGGFVYHGAQSPALDDAYLYADICAGTISALRPDGADGGYSQRTLLTTDLSITSFGQDEAGEIYVTAYQHGSLYRVVADDSLARTWARADAPVADGDATRTWLWGPEPFTTVLTESYAEAPGGERYVQYFDKGRLELTDPAGNPADPWRVSAGLLVNELTSGNVQLGDDAFEQRDPAQVNVAGDADDPAGPTYATFGVLRDAPAAAPGALLTQRLARDGTLTDDPTLAAYGATAATRVSVPGLDHSVAAPFWAFMTSTGPVEIDGQLVNAPLFANPFAATGYPISEAYWATVRVGGVPHDVLTQCFERRCLTWTPDNPDGWQVETGNVGQHYYAWRYASP